MFFRFATLIMNNRYALFFDIDGTLVSFKTHQSLPTPRRAVLEEINRIHMESSPGEVMSVYNEKINEKKKK